MERLNYLNFYDSKSFDHEDQLTRAFMVLMKYSFHVSTAFYYSCFQYYSGIPKVINDIQHLPFLNDLINKTIIYETQKENPEIDTEFLVSVLITDDTSNIEKVDVIISDRNARYDGIITFGDNITFVIEVKPRTGNNFNTDQLMPTKHNLSDDTRVLRIPIYIQWKDIIKFLHSLHDIQSISAQEKMLIDDFLGLVDKHFPHLNPYNNFGLCKNNEELIKRRIENIFLQIVNDTNIVDYHRGWGNILKLTGHFKEINMIGLIVDKKTDGDSWFLILSISFGVLIPQARSLYDHNLIENIKNSNLLNEGWKLSSEFRLTYRGDNLIDFPQRDWSNYIQYWANNKSEIKQFKRDEVKSQLLKLDKNNVVVFKEEEQQLFEKKFMEKNYDKANFVAGLNLRYDIPDKEAILLDSKNEFSKFLVNKIRDAFKLIGDQNDNLDKLFKKSFD